MSFDMSQFYQVFFEEAAEHLAGMESLLLDVDRDNPDEEQLNAIFRAAHSIKGSAGTFGFKDLAEVTHVLETLLDRIRKGEVALTEEMVDAFLEAGDVLKDLLAAHRGEGAADADAVACVCEKLKRLTDQAASVGAASIACGGQDPVAPGPAGTVQSLNVRFVIDAPAASAGGIVDNLLAELRHLGEVSVTETPPAGVTGVPWQLSLTTDADIDAVRGLLEFVAVADSIVVAERDVCTPVGSAAKEDDAYGFFSLETANPAPAGGIDEAFGLFEENGTQSRGVGTGMAAEANESGNDAAQGYGLFESVTPPPADAPGGTTAPAGPAAPVVAMKDAKGNADARTAKESKGAPKAAGDSAAKMAGDAAAATASAADKGAEVAGKAWDATKDAAKSAGKAASDAVDSAKKSVR